VYSISCCPHANEILPNFLAPHERLSGHAVIERKVIIAFIHFMDFFRRLMYWDYVINTNLRFGGRIGLRVQASFWNFFVFLSATILCGQSSFILHGAADELENSSGRLTSGGAEKACSGVGRMGQDIVLKGKVPYHYKWAGIAWSV
jgi:hypothetical protein